MGFVSLAYDEIDVAENQKGQMERVETVRDVHFASFLRAISRKFLMSVTSEGILTGWADPRGCRSDGGSECEADEDFLVSC